METVDFFNDRIARYSFAVRRSQSAKIRGKMMLGISLAESLIEGREFCSIVPGDSLWPAIPANLWPEEGELDD